MPRTLRSSVRYQPCVGNIYVVFPTSELDDEARDWLADQGVVLPAAMGRWPSARELRATLDALPGYVVEYTDSAMGWDAEVRKGDERAAIWAQATQTPDAPCDFTFHKPNEQLALRILERLSHVCGPLVLIPKSSTQLGMRTISARPGLRRTRRCRVCASLHCMRTISARPGLRRTRRCRVCASLH
jgi:hypothetical protein